MIDEEALGRIRSDAVDHARTPVGSLSDAAVFACLAVLIEAEQALDVVRRRLAEEVVSRGIPVAGLAPDTARWLRDRLFEGSDPRAG